MVRTLSVFRSSNHRFLHTCLQLNYGIIVHRSARIRATKFCTVAPKIFSIIIAGFFPYVEKCVSFHFHRAGSARYQWRSQFTADFVGPQNGT
jgi:hypothetical protein